jgi:two-component system, chemotaxis family, protein-glutamate methylesterase/glutaminase
VLVVLHLAPQTASMLPRILDRAGPLAARHPQTGETPLAGTIMIAPPDLHLEIGEDGGVVLSRGPRENGYRPAIDRLFTTAAAVYGRRVIGVVLSGALDDGSAGLVAVARAGGAALVEDPGDALYPAMPENAIAAVPAAEVVPLTSIADRIVELVGPGSGPEAGGSQKGGRAVDTDQAPAPESPDEAQDGVVSGFTCPECSGALWEVDEGGLLRYRCRVGHAYSTESLVAEQGVALEAALWTGLRALEERAALFHRLARRFEGDAPAAGRYRRQAEEAHTQSRLVRAAIEQLHPMAESA